MTPIQTHPLAETPGEAVLLNRLERGPLSMLETLSYPSEVVMALIERNLMEGYGAEMRLSRKALSDLTKIRAATGRGVRA